MMSRQTIHVQVDDVDSNELSFNRFDFIRVIAPPLGQGSATPGRILVGKDSGLLQFVIDLGHHVG